MNPLSPLTPILGCRWIRNLLEIFQVTYIQCDVQIHLFFNGYLHDQKQASYHTLYNRSGTHIRSGTFLYCIVGMFFSFVYFLHNILVYITEICRLPLIFLEMK